MSQAADLMIAGMGFVFAFLVILVFATLLMSKIIARFAPEPATPAKTPRAKPKTPAAVDPDTAEAIKKAIAQYRSRHKK
ncbi:OadG family transporter subunit [Marinobacter sp. chi1]|uniref:Probable oxaloacetate decarboxylase gamma chain n=2 Tax=Marinobacteraceae TaxID=2887365 RepID=A0ABT8W0Y8_9GAMM|nr:OadG family transporter subunit [Marinobacter sp. chi1]MDO3721899.1 OadG family transporter subunit [Marinobacter sp. chi1]